MIIANVHRATRAEACERLAGGISFAEGLRKLCFSLRGMNLLVSACVLFHARINDYSSSRKVLLRTRNATLTRRADANRRPRRPKQPADFAEGSRKLRGRVAPCLQASAHEARVAQ